MRSSPHSAEMLKKKSPSAGPLAWVAACSAVAALVLALVGYAAFETLLDPLVDSFNSLTWVTP